MTVFTCEDNFDAMMTCVYEAWASRLGHSNVKLKTEPIGNLELFCDYWHADADPEKTASVIRSIKNKISYQAYLMIYEAAMSDADDKLDTIYRFMVAGFHFNKTALLLNAGADHVFDAAIAQYKAMTSYLKWEDQGIITAPNMVEKGKMKECPELEKVKELAEKL